MAFALVAAITGSGMADPFSCLYLSLSSGVNTFPCRSPPGSFVVFLSPSVLVGSGSASQSSSEAFDVLFPEVVAFVTVGAREGDLLVDFSTVGAVELFGADCARATKTTSTIKQLAKIEMLPLFGSILRDVWVLLRTTETGETRKSAPKFNNEQ